MLLLIAVATQTASKRLHIPVTILLVLVGWGWPGFFLPALALPASKRWTAMRCGKPGALMALAAPGLLSVQDRLDAAAAKFMEIEGPRSGVDRVADRFRLAAAE